MIANASTMHAMTNNNGSSSAPSATSYTLNDNLEISSTVSAEMQWVVTKDGNNFQFQVSGTSNYLYCTNTNNGVRVGTNSNNVFTITTDNTTHPTYQQLKNSATSRYVGVYNSQDWRCYTSATASNIIDCNTVFFKKVSGGSTVETVATPTFSPEEGTYTEAQNVEINCTTDGATIYYTTDGNDPTTSSSVYSSAIPVSSTTTIKAIAVKDGMNNSQVASATYTIETPSTDQYELVTNASSLAAGDKIIIASTDTDGSGKAMSTTQNSNNRGATDVTISNSIITPGSSVQIITLEKDGDNWLFNVGSGYLYAASSSSNHLKTEATPDANGNAKATISITSNAATVTFQGTNTRNLLKYNSGNDIFSCYASGQSPVYIYKKVESTPQSSDVYIIGQVDGHDSDPWVSTEGVKMTYNSTNDNYAANIYCTGVNNGTHEGYSLFLFAKSLPYDWNTTSNLYGSGADGSYWGIGGTNESAFGDEIPLYEGSKNSYRLPAGLYTVTVDLDYTGHEYTTKSVKVTKRDVTMTISPSSAYFAETQNVTMESNLTDIGGKIYYTTNGNDPRDQYSGRQEYTGQLTISETTTFKAVAYVGNLYSDVVEKTYTKTPAAPEITPASCTFSEPFQVTITAESGATIYYTTDGSNPTDQSTQYTGPFTVSTTTTVKAKAYVNGVYGATATETYTYSNVQPSTGDFTLVKSANDIVAGREYIIINSDRNAAASTVSGTKFSVTDDFTLSNNNETASAGSAVKVFTLEATGNDLFYLKDVDGTYYTPNSSSTDIDSDKNAIYIAYDGGYVLIKNSSSASRSIAYNHQASTHVFGSYSNPTPTGNQRPIYLYYRETNSVQPPVFSPIAGIYNVDIDVTISCATDGATIYYTTDGTEPSATNGTEYTGEIIVSESTTFKAIAVKGENSSSVVTAAYTIQKSTNIETVTLDYSEPFTAGIGKFFVTNNTGFSPVWTLDGNFGVKGTSYEPATGTNHAATSRLVSPIIDMTDAVQPDLTFSHQINNYFNDVTTQATLWIRETSNGTSGTWVQLPITFSDPAAAGGWTNDVVDIDLTDVNGVSYAGKKVQISFLYTNPTEGSGAGTWEIQNFVVADNSEYRMVNNIAEFLALPENTKAKFKNPVTVLYDYAQYSSNSYHEYIWVKDESSYMQFYLVPTLNSSTESSLDPKAAYYENGDIIPAGFVVVKNYYENGKYVQAFSADALNAGFLPATQKGLADPEYMDFDVLDDLNASNTDDVATWCNHYITLEKIKLTSSSKNFNFQDENGNENACVGYNKYNGDGSLLKGGTTSADVIMPTDLTKFYNVKGIIQLWQGGWEFMPIEFTEWKEEEMTLRTLCQDGVVNHDYKISNNLLGVYASADGTKLWVKDDNGQSISPYAPDATYKDNFPINAEGNTRLDQQYYDQSNWCEIQLKDENAGNFVGKIIKGGSINGTFSNKTNPTMTGVTLTDNDIYSDGSYEPNYYIPCNFYGNQSCQTSQHGQPGHGDFFFMTPKPQEYATIVWAIWDSDSQKMVITEDPNKNSHQFKGSFSINLNMNSGITDPEALHDGMDDGFAYNFNAIIRVNSSKAGSDLMVYPLDLSAATDPSTAIESVVAGNGEVKSVKYVNVAGMVSDAPFQGVNIVITEYTDGTRTTSKMLRK